MGNKAKVAGLLLGGYMLGRGKKLKLALTVAATVGGSKLYSQREEISKALGSLERAHPNLAVWPVRCRESHQPV
ncbi:hypothetical protein [Nesterenkonia pannonica]|uniref:hypothetical protein n=1 Tax=Nesterenkonia pannonica TaxID=1548602 RepID=UPI002164C347|nr:hypothetical protein [Nesterenkonia pannonica]